MESTKRLKVMGFTYCIGKAPCFSFSSTMDFRWSLSVYYLCFKPIIHFLICYLKTDKGSVEARWSRVMMQQSHSMAPLFWCQTGTHGDLKLVYTTDGQGIGTPTAWSCLNIACITENKLHTIESCCLPRIMQ